MPSRTALRVAALRALHQSADAPPVFVDPLAGRILSSAALPLGAYRDAEAETRRLRATLAARAVVAEETVAETVRRGARQCAIIGAGLDTFAYRHTHDDLIVYEVDHPSTQTWKRGLLRDAGIAEPATVRFVATDLGTGELATALASAGFAASAAAVFVMLGVTPYLAQETLVGLLADIAAAAAPGSEIVLDYTEPYDDAPAVVRAQYEAAAESVAALGEPWVTLMRPSVVAAALADIGFGEIVDLDAAALDARFCVGRPDGFKVAPLVHLLRAKILHPEAAFRHQGA